MPAPISSTVPYTGFTSSDKPATVTTTMVNPPTVPTTTPTAAPKVSTSPVVSSSTATNYLNKTVIPTMNTAQQALSDYQAKKNVTTIDKKTGADGVSELYMSDGSRIKTDANGNIMPTTTPEQQIADTADVGYKFAYASDGTRTQIPINESATLYGMSDTNPTVAPTKPVLATAELPSGTSVKQFNDGTYGMYDVNGKYVGAASSTQFRNAQNGQEVLDKLNQAVNGQFPLTSNQQAQIDSIKAVYSNLIKEQEKANANFTGGTTVAQNLYGIGNTTMAQGAIKGVIDDGISKVADIQSRMNSDVAKMTSAFQSDNLQALKDAYNSYANNAKELQNNLDRVESQTAQIARDEKQQRAQAELAIDNDVRGLIDTAAANGATTQQLQAMQEALLNHDYTAAAKAGGDALMNAPGVVGEYYAYARDAKSRGVIPMSMDDYFTKDANRKARVAAAGAARYGGSTGITKDELKIINGVNSVITSSPVYKTVQSAAAFVDGVTAALQQETGLGDIAAINQFQKVVDEGAVTRDQDVKLVLGAQTVMNRLNTWKQRNIDTGDVMGDELRQQMKDVMDGLLKVKVERLLKSPEVASQLRIAERTGVSKEDTILGNLSNIGTTVGSEHLNAAVAAKSVVDKYIKANPAEAEMVANLYETPGTTDEDVQEFLRGAGKI